MTTAPPIFAADKVLASSSEAGCSSTKRRVHVKALKQKHVEHVEDGFPGIAEIFIPVCDLYTLVESEGVVEIACIPTLLLLFSQQLKESIRHT